MADAAARYDAWYATPRGRLTHALEQAAVFALAPPPGGWALDVACGTGLYAAALARRGWRVAALDRSLAMLRRAPDKAAGAPAPPAPVAGDAMALPFRDATFRLVSLVLGLEFVADPLAALREARRVLRPDGVAIVAALAPRAPWTLWRRLKRRLSPSVWRRARFVGEAELCRRLATAGFAVTERRRAVHYLPLPLPVAWLDRWERRAAAAPALAAFVALRAEPREPQSRTGSAPVSTSRASRG